MKHLDGYRTRRNSTMYEPARKPFSWSHHDRIQPRKKQSLWNRLFNKRWRIRKNYNDEVGPYDFEYYMFGDSLSILRFLIWNGFLFCLVVNCYLINSPLTRVKLGNKTWFTKCSMLVSIWVKARKFIYRI